MTAAHPEVQAYISTRKARRTGRPIKYRSFVAASFVSPAGLNDVDFSANPSASSSNAGAAGPSSSSPVPGAANPSSAAASEPAILAPNTLVQGDWVDEDALRQEQLLRQHNQPKLNLAVQVSELESLASEEDRRTLDIKVQQEDTKKAFHSTRNNVLEAAGGAGGAVASAWGKVDKEAVRIAKEESEKRREATRPVHLGQDYIPSAAHAGTKPGYDYTMGPSGLGYYWNPQPEAKPASFAVAGSAALGDEPVKKSVWGGANTGYLRGGPRLSEAKTVDPTPAAAAAAAAAKPGVWRPSTREAPGPSAAASGPPRVSAGAAFASRVQASSAPPPPQPSSVNDDGRDSSGLKRSSNAWRPRGRD